MRITRRTALKTLVATAAGVAVGGGVYGYTYARRRLELVRARLSVSGLPSSLDGLRVGLVTDIHHGPFVSLEDIARAVALVMTVQPDLIALGGDYVNWQDRPSIEPCAEVLGTLRAPCGVFAVLGNHDNERATSAAMKRRGIELLTDERTRLVIRGEPIELAGLRYWTRRIKEIAPVVHGAAAPLVLIAHDPRRLVEAAALDVQVVLSGHSHGGQVVLPLVGAIGPRRFPVIAGVGRRENTGIFVSRGVGTILVPYRLNCPPDVAVLTLERRGEL